MATLEQTLKQNHDWTLNRVRFLEENDRHNDAVCIVQEFSEWLDPRKDDHEIFSLTYIGEGSEYDG